MVSPMPADAVLDPNHFVDLVDGQFARTTAAQCEAMFAHARNVDHLAVHFHGGLVSRGSALASGVDLISTYRDAGAYPVFFLWNSDLPTLIKGSWDEIPREKAFQILVRRLTQLAIGKLSSVEGRRGGTVSAAPSLRTVPENMPLLSKYARTIEPTLSREGKELSADEQHWVEQELDEDEDIREVSAAIALGEQHLQGKDAGPTRRGGLPQAPPTPSLMSAGVREEIRRDVFGTPGQRARRGVVVLALARHGAAILLEVVKRFIAHRDHGLYTTIVEEVARRLYVDSLGQLAWELMKRDTLDAFEADASLHGGSAFLRHLAAWHKPGRRITLIGHSTGAVYIGNLLRTAESTLAPDISFEVVFLAPACSFEFMHSCLPAFRNRVGDRIRSFGLCNEREQGYFEVPVLYEGSLLYMVSGLFEMTAVDKEIVGMQRFFRTEHPYDDVACREVRSYLEGKTVWSPCDDPEGRRCDAPRHGGFTVDAHMRDSLSHMLRNGIQ